MIVQCDACKKRFKVPDGKITPKGVKVRCGKCGHTFRIFPQGELEADPFAALGLPVPSSPAEADPFAALGLGVPVGSPRPPPAPHPSPAPDDLFAGLVSPAPAAEAPSAGFGEDPFDQPTRVVDNPLAVGMAGAPAFTPPPLPTVDASEAPVPLPRSSAPVEWAPEPQAGAPSATLGRIQPKSIAVPMPAPDSAPSAPPVPDDDPFGALPDFGAESREAHEAPGEIDRDPFGSTEGALNFGSEPGAQSPSIDPFAPPPPEPLESFESFESQASVPAPALAAEPPPVVIGRLMAPTLPEASGSEEIKDDTAKRLALGAARMSGAIVNIAVAAALLVGVVVVGNVYFHEGRFNFSAFSPSHLTRLWASQPRVITEDLSNGLYGTLDGESILFVRGEVKNLTSRAGRVKVTAELFDGDQLIRPSAVYAGRAPSPEALAEVDGAAGLARLVKKLDDAARSIPPGGTATFLVPFYQYPSDISSLHLKVSASLPEPLPAGGVASAKGGAPAPGASDTVGSAKPPAVKPAKGSGPTGHP